MSAAAEMLPRSDHRSITILTSRPFHPTALALVDACADLGVVAHCGSSMVRGSVLAFQWSLDSYRTRAAVRALCDRHGIPFINPHLLDKWVQLRRLGAAGIVVPRTRRARTIGEAMEGAYTIGFPVVLKPLFGLKSQAVDVVRDEEELASTWSARHGLVQQYLPEGGRCTRLLVVGSQVVHAVSRVAFDGIHATYAHGSRAWLEPFELTPGCEAAALGACVALGLEIAGVDLVLTSAGPVILEVNHSRVEFHDNALHGAGAVRSVAGHLAYRAMEAKQPAGWVARPVVRIVTGLPRSSEAALLKQACERVGLSADVGYRAVATADAVWFWGLRSSHHRTEGARARAMALPSINGAVQTAWQQRASLFRAGFRVPRSRPAWSLESALRAAEEIGYPIALRHPRDPSRDPTPVASRSELVEAWPDGSGRVLEEARYDRQLRWRVWVAGERAFRASRSSTPRSDDTMRWIPTPLRTREADVAVAVCQALRVDLGVVEMVIESDELIILRVLLRGTWLRSLPNAERVEAIDALAGVLRDRIGRISTADRARPTPHLSILAARDFHQPEARVRIGNIQAVYHELLRQGNRVVSLDGGFHRGMVDDADLILQDPLQVFGFRPRGDALDDELYEVAAARSHLLRRLRSGTNDKLAMSELARELDIPAPAVFRPSEVTEGDLPVIIKPRQGSLGIGVQLARTIARVRAATATAGGARALAQQHIDSRAGYAVSIRAVTVVDRIAAAAVFYNRGAVCSNLAQGGRAVALTGPGQRVRLTRRESTLLEKIGIDPMRREVPASVREMASAVGRHHAAHGAQMIGQDFVVDHLGRWHFLEVNMGFGTAVFNVTDGEGYPHNGRGLVFAGRVLAAALAAQFGAGGRHGT